MNKSDVELFKKTLGEKGFYEMVANNHINDVVAYLFGQKNKDLAMKSLKEAVFFLIKSGLTQDQAMAKIDKDVNSLKKIRGH